MVVPDISKSEQREISFGTDVNMAFLNCIFRRVQSLFKDILCWFRLGNAAEFDVECKPTGWLKGNLHSSFRNCIHDSFFKVKFEILFHNFIHFFLLFFRDSQLFKLKIDVQVRFAVVLHHNLHYFREPDSHRAEVNFARLDPEVSIIACPNHSNLILLNEFLRIIFLDLPTSRVEKSDLLFERVVNAGD